MTQSVRFDLSQIIVSSVIMLAGGLISGISWPFVFFAGLAVGLTTNDGKYTYILSLCILAFWIFLSSYTPFLEYSFPFPPQAEGFYNFVYQINPDHGFDVLAWVLILLTNWLGVFMGKRTQTYLTQKFSRGQES